jgi:Anti-sigma factor NepR
MKNNKAKDNDRISDLIDQNLKMVYSDLAEEKLPDRFKDLLDVLAAQDVELKDKK